MGDPGWPALAEGMAAELQDARDDLEALAVGLCSDPAVFRDHGEALQRFDALAQIIGEIAALLRRHGGDAANALAAIRLDAVRQRIASVGSSEEAAR